MLVYNSFHLIGVLEEAPQKGTTKAGTPYARFKIATTESYTTKTGEEKTTTNHYEISTYLPQAMMDLQRAPVGSQVSAAGNILSNERRNRDGAVFYNLMLMANKVSVDDTAVPPRHPADTGFNTGPNAVIDNEDLPF